MLVMWEEKVDRFCSMDCSSPMSDLIFSNTPTVVREEAGRGMPHWARAQNRPMVFRVTVLPPVLGPVMTTTRLGVPREMVMGTARAPRRGWRASTSSTRPSEARRGRVASWARA